MLQNPPVVEKRPLKLKKYVKAIADLRVPLNEFEYKNQMAEAAWFKERGYNTLIVTFLGESDLSYLSRTLQELKRARWKFVLAPSVLWKKTMYIDPELYKQAFALIVPYCDFALCAWRDMSNGRHWREEEKLTRARDLRIIASLIREADPDLPIVGEQFYHGHDEPMGAFHDTWTDGTTLLNVGAVLEMQVPNVELLRKRVEDDKVLAVITGVKPYHGFDPHRRNCPLVWNGSR